MNPAERSPAIAVLGLGNVLMGDDALGPTVIATLLAQWELPAEVEALDLGTPGLDLHPFLARRQAVVLVDTVRADDAPGGLRRYTLEDILRKPPGPRVSPHDPGLKEALLALQFQGSGPGHVVLVGVIPERVDNSPGLGPVVRAVVVPAVEMVVRELRALGCGPRPRVPPTDPDLWWERGAGDAPGPQGSEQRDDDGV